MVIQSEVEGLIPSRVLLRSYLGQVAVLPSQSSTMWEWSQSGDTLPVGT